MSKQEKAKIVVSFQSYGGFVLDSDKAMQIMEMLRGAERYQTKYHHNSGSDSTTTVHVWPYEGDAEIVRFQYLTDSQYALAKITGKPED